MSAMFGAALALPAALGAVLVANELRSSRRGSRVGDRMNALAATALPVREIERWSKAALLACGRRLVGRRRQRERIARLLIGAGFFTPQALAFFGFLRAASALVGVVVGGLAARALTNPHVPAAALPLACLVVAWLLPAAVLNGFATRQTRRLQAELPIVMSLVLMTVESGSTVDQALRFAGQAAERAHLSVARSLRAALDEIGTGAAYEQALARLGERIDVAEGRDFAALLAQSITAGTQIGEALRILIGDLLEKRVAAAREAIGRRAVLISVILILCFMPVLFILIGAPMASSLFQALSHGVVK